jgi:hypothetical protein
MLDASNPAGTYTAQCEGWWEQNFHGRQPMLDLTLQFRGEEIHGSGRDIVGLFTIRGTLNAQGEVFLVKQYQGRHSVKYFGRYDGEGVLAGEWRIFFDHGRWAIKIKTANTT